MTEQQFPDYTLCYLPSGSVTHLFWDHKGSIQSGRQALCGVAPQWFDPRGWWGTGSQAEIDKALERRLCRACRKLHDQREGK